MQNQGLQSLFLLSKTLSAIRALECLLWLLGDRGCRRELHVFHMTWTHSHRIRHALNENYSGNSFLVRYVIGTKQCFSKLYYKSRTRVSYFSLLSLVAVDIVRHLALRSTLSCRVSCEEFKRWAQDLHSTSTTIWPMLDCFDGAGRAHTIWYSSVCFCKLNKEAV